MPSCHSRAKEYSRPRILATQPWYTYVQYATLRKILTVFVSVVLPFIQHIHMVLASRSNGLALVGPAQVLLLCASLCARSLRNSNGANQSAITALLATQRCRVTVFHGAGGVLFFRVYLQC